VLTDESFSRLAGITWKCFRRNLDSCLRKDFIIDEFSNCRARAHCADGSCCRSRSGTEGTDGIRAHARDHELDVLCEVHDHAELQRAHDAGCDLIGVNSRDLRLSRSISPRIAFGRTNPSECVRVAESGIQSGADVGAAAAGYDAFLIGES